MNVQMARRSAPGLGQGAWGRFPRLICGFLAAAFILSPCETDPFIMPACVAQPQADLMDLGEPLKDPALLLAEKAARPDSFERVMSIVKWLTAVPKPTDHDLSSLGPPRSALPCHIQPCHRQV